jgi:hypothetical protein
MEETIQEYIDSIPDDILTQLDILSLEKICQVITIDLYFISKEKKKN